MVGCSSWGLALKGLRLDKISRIESNLALFVSRFLLDPSPAPWGLYYVDEHGHISVH